MALHALASTIFAVHDFELHGVECTARGHRHTDKLIENHFIFHSFVALLLRRSR